MSGAASNLVSCQVREIRLYGRLGAQFGRVFRLAVQSPAEAVQALCAMLPGFQAAFIGRDGRAEYVVYTGRGAERKTISEAQKDDLVDAQAPIRFVPVIEGAKRQGVGQTILGVVMVVAGVVASAFGYGAVGGPLAKAGWMMVIGGVIQMLSPQRGPTEKTNNGDPSYGMDAGAVNTSDAGMPVPLAYGRVIAGSVRISAGLTTDEVAVPAGGGGGFGDQQLPAYMERFEVDSGAVLTDGSYDSGG